jgi:hypothetical protein
MTCSLNTEVKPHIKSEEVIIEKKIRTREQNQYRKHIFDTFPEVFTEKVGCMKGVEFDFHIDRNIKPSQAACRPIPVHLRDKVEKEIDVIVSNLNFKLAAYDNNLPLTPLNRSLRRS